MNKIIENYIKNYSSEFKEALKLIKEFDKICIFRHRVPDFDALGSQLGLFNFLLDNFPEKDIIVTGDDHIKFTPKLFRPMDQIDDYWFDDDFLAIVVDVSEKDRVSDERISKAKRSIVFDHHPCSEPFGSVRVIDTQLAAASELVSAFCISTKLNIGREAASNLYVALVGDSGRFLYSSTSPFTFAIAEQLVNCDININELYTLMYETTIQDLEITKYILSNYKLSKHGVAYYVLSDTVLKNLGISQLSAKAFVNTFANVKGINVWCSISEDTVDNCWRVSIRSKRLDISGIAKKYQGGGHAQASGATLDTVAQIDKMVTDLDDLIAQQEN